MGLFALPSILIYNSALLTHWKISKRSQQNLYGLEIWKGYNCRITQTVGFFQEGIFRILTFIGKKEWISSSDDIWKNVILGSKKKGRPLSEKLIWSKYLKMFFEGLAWEEGGHQVPSHFLFSLNQPHCHHHHHHQKIRLSALTWMVHNY